MYIKEIYYRKSSMFKLVNWLSTWNMKELCNLGKHFYPEPLRLEKVLYVNELTV